jgi:hypothetical protein
MHQGCAIRVSRVKVDIMVSVDDVDCFGQHADDNGNQTALHPLGGPPTHLWRDTLDRTPSISHDGGSPSDLRRTLLARHNQLLRSRSDRQQSMETLRLGRLHVIGSQESSVNLQAVATCPVREDLSNCHKREAVLP